MWLNSIICHKPLGLASLFFLALALSLDALAVAISTGLAVRRARWWHALKVAFWFGLFQALMPVLGYQAGFQICHFIGCVDHWLAFGLLTLIGGKMIFDALRREERTLVSRPLTVAALFVLSVATSLDALAVGLSLSVFGQGIFLPALLIGVVTFGVCLPGGLLGSRLGSQFGRKIEILGGLILIAIGINVLLTHLRC